MTEHHLGASRIAGPDACRAVLLAGELNPYGADPDYALYYEPATSAGGRLQRVVLGLPARHWYLPIWRVNLCAGAFDAADAARRAVELCGDAPWRTIVLLGKRVQRAFALPDLSPTIIEHELYDPERRLIGIPHPSGRNQRAYSLDVISAVRAVMDSQCPDIPWGSLGVSGGP